MLLLLMVNIFGLKLLPLQLINSLMPVSKEVGLKFSETCLFLFPFRHDDDLTSSVDRSTKSVLDLFTEPWWFPRLCDRDVNSSCDRSTTLVMGLFTEPLVMSTTTGHGDEENGFIFIGLLFEFEFDLMILILFTWSDFEIKSLCFCVPTLIKELKST